ncbi:MAG: DUF1273 family protein [Clostridia bacterium]|nr:DUF1273 family protein [Clostridia bacterium]
MGKICIFTGHRELPASTGPLYDALLRHITALYDGGCTDFVSGGAMGFDLLAAEAVLALRPLYPDMRLVMILPCLGQERAYSAADKERYRALLDQADMVRYTAHQYYRGCMLTRDRVMAEAAHHCICWLTRSTGGTAYTVRQCVLRDVPIINLAELCL